MLKAMRNFRAPVTVAPQLGTKELGPKSGAHSACLSCREAHPRVLYPIEGHPIGAGERKRVHTPTGFTPDPPAIGGTRHLLRQSLVLPCPDGRQGPATGHLCRLAVEVHCKGSLAGQSLAGGQSRPPFPEENRGRPLPPASAWQTDLPPLLSLQKRPFPVGVTDGHSVWARTAPLHTQGQDSPPPLLLSRTDVPEKAISWPGELRHATGRTFTFLSKMYFHCTINMTTN